VASPDVHAESLAISSALSKYYVPGFIPPLDVIKVLNEASVKFILAGSHGLGGWRGKPRATQDVDVLVWSRHHRRAVKALRTAYPDLECEESDELTKFREQETGKTIIDLLKSDQGVYRAAFRHTQPVEMEGQEFLIPSLEMAVAMKFAPLVDPNRWQADKFQDAHDVMCTIGLHPDLDNQILAELGELVCAGGGREILELVRRVRAGEKLDI
jgi:hypothetical protein